VLLAAPVAILINILRVAVLGLLSMVDANLAAGQAHTLIGTLLLIPGLMLFLLVVWTLNKVVGDRPAPETGAPA
jgi:exosortase/archaeosortase family protein